MLDVTNKLEWFKLTWKNFSKEFLIFKNSLQVLISEYEVKMKELTEKEKMRRRRNNLSLMKLKKDIQEETKVKIFPLTSELWESVILITSGIETSVRATEEIKKFSSIYKGDYNLKNQFEITHP